MSALGDDVAVYIDLFIVPFLIIFINILFKVTIARINVTDTGVKMPSVNPIRLKLTLG